MNTGYKLILANKNFYKEVELAQDEKQIKIGTGKDCDVRFRKDLFFGSVELLLVKNDAQWSVICSDGIYLSLGDVRKLFTKKLAHGDCIEVRYQESDNIVFTMDFMIDFDDGRRVYERSISMEGISSMTIGRSSASNVVLSSKFINNDQILLFRQQDGYILDIQNATYGICINGKKACNGDMLHDGDFLSIADYFFYYRKGWLLTEIRSDMQINSLSVVDKRIPEAYPKFNRNTRLKTVVCDDTIDILDPPAEPEKPKGGIIQQLLPSLGMLLAAAVMVILYNSPTMIIMSGITGCISIGTAIMTFRNKNKEYREIVAERIEKYNSYISEKCREIEWCRGQEQTELENIYVSQWEEIRRVSDFDSALFDRQKEDADFLSVRLGNGDVISKRTINYKKQEKLEIGDALQQMPEQVCNQYGHVHNAPVVCQFAQCNAIGIVGNSRYRYDFLKNIVIDVAARQFFSDVKIMLVAEPANKEYIYWLRMLPHVFNEELGIRNIVCDDESKNLMFEYLYKELTTRQQKKAYTEHIVVFFYDEYGFKTHPISRFVENAKDLGITFVFFGDTTADIPQGCDYVVTIRDGSSASLINTQDQRDVVEFVYPMLRNEQAEQIVQILAPVYTEEISLEGTLTKNISLFELLGIIAVEDLDLRSRWSKSQVFKSMSAPLGISKAGLISLDLHDKAHGPHGLVAGTTGSGKSEILQTYILSMATLFSPQEVGFVIIDFKGGGMVNQFKELPHLMGAITNIDGKEINRSLKSIKAELQKRQKYFAAADVNHIDKYIRKYKAGEVKEPLPHLIIIVDEFAELKAEQPEFMKELISAARIGRSLGVHLILATQKPSGQVNEQIWSNSRFKLCLKVQSQEDSNEVLKSPLAAEIKEPGRAYLQVGNNEIFELFQSAYSGSAEKEDETNVKEFSIFSLTPSGKRVPVYAQKKRTSENGGRTQLEAIVDYVAQYCQHNEIKKLPDICLPPLEDYLTVPDNLGDYTLDSIPLGVYDDPDSQYQGLAHFNLCDDNTMIIGASQTGKTNLVQSIIRLVSSKYSPKDAVFYIADFGAMYLKNFETLHHVGGVVTISEGEKFKNLFKLLTEEVQRRKVRFLDCGLSSYAAYREAGYTDLPHIFFVIDNFSAFKEVYADAYEDQFVYLTREGVSCGISILVTNASTNGLGYRYMSNFGCRLSFRCNDAGEYMNIFDRCRMQPKDVPGRMLCKLDKELYEMQSFIAFEGVKELDRSNAVKKFVDDINAQYPGEMAKKIPSIPEVLTFDYIDNNYNFKMSGYQYPIALDYSNVDVVVLDFKTWNEFCIIGKDAGKKVAATNNIMAAIHHNVLSKPVEMYIIDGIERQLKAKADFGYVEKYTIDYSEIGSIFDSLIPELEKRHQLLMDGELDQLAKCAQIIILINNKDAVEYMSTTKEILEVYTRMVKQFKSLGVAFIFSDIEDVAVGYSGPELLKRFKDSKKAIITSNLQEFKFCDLSSAAVRNNKTVNVGDVFLLDGSDVTRIKLAEEVRK